MPLRVWQKIQAMSRQTELNPSTLQVVALVLQNHRGDVLLTQRQAGKHLEGYWEFPGGKVEANESMQQALRREIREELNYTPKNLSHLLTVDHQYPEKHVQIHFFSCFDDDAQVQPMEQQAMQWFPRSSLNDIKLPPANTGVLDLI